jgi:predicted glycosyltransferase
MRIWIDLANSPHPLLFGPIATQLERLGHTVLVTARDNAQTLELTRQRWPRAEVIGGPTPAPRSEKVKDMARRVERLAAWARRRRPELALSHNSYAQIVAAWGLRIRVVTGMDYEHQPANHLAFRLAHAVLLPEALRGTVVARQGASAAKTRFYPGLKEELYLGDFEPDPTVVARAGVQRDADTVLVVARTPPTGALYHQFENGLFTAALGRLAGHQHVRCVALVRHGEQREELAALGEDRVTVPRHALDSRSLMYTADLVLGAGGTMTREAALLGVPTLSVFAGRPPAVDQWLERQEVLRFVRDVDELPAPRRRERDPKDVASLRRRAEELIDLWVEAATERTGLTRRARIASLGAHG